MTETEALIYKPYNNMNNEINTSEIEKILCNYGIKDKITNINLYRRAFVHKSYVKKTKEENLENGITLALKPYDCIPLKTKSNERLEFLGDGVLENITKFYLYRRFPKENEGFMTEKKIALVKNESIGRIAYEMGLNKWYIISKHAEEKKTRTNLKKLGCLFEAFLGAIFLDFNKKNVDDDNFRDIFSIGPGFQYCLTFVEKVFEKHVNWTELIIQNDNYKNLLQIKLQREFKITPSYRDINYTDDYGYYMGVYICIGDIIQNFNLDTSIKITSIQDISTLIEKNEKTLIKLGEGKHKIKKKAEQLACFMAINNIE
jgi:dsRNA-specific ribonuclease